MANLTQHLTSISPDLRSGSPGRRLLALVLCSMLILASISPGVALASEVDSPLTSTPAAKKPTSKKCRRPAAAKKTAP